ncbi:MAG: TIGR01777 family oxidoreductase [bacterium]
MKLLITGASGLIGSALEPFLRKAGHDVNRLVRHKESASCCDFYWDPYADELDRAALEGIEGVIHLSGENIAARWTESKKQKILDSRVKPTRFLSKIVSDLETPPKVLISASAIGYYGDRGDEVLTEKSKFGSGFLSDVVRQWEAATTPAAVKGIRVLTLRLGVVLSRHGGALARMVPPFKMGAGGIVGNGDQYWSWVGIDDVVGALNHALTTDTLEGPVNVVAPNPVTNREFTKVLGRVLGRPTFVPMPAFAARIAFGEMAQALLLASARVEPAKLKATNYEFWHPELEELLHYVLEIEGASPAKEEESAQETPN